MPPSNVVTAQFPKAMFTMQQDQLVSLENLSPACQCHVTQLLSATKILHNCEKARVVIIPFQQKFFLRHFDSSLCYFSFTVYWS